MDGGQFIPTQLARQSAALVPGEPHPMLGVSFLHRELGQEVALPPPVEPEVIHDDSAARQEGFDAGYIAGLDSAAASNAALQAKLLDDLVTTLARELGAAARVAEQTAGALADALVAAMSAVMPELIRGSALREGNAMLAAILPGLSHEPTVQIEVPMGFESPLTSSLSGLAGDIRAKVGIVEREEMKEGELSVRWTGGAAHRRPADVWRDVMRLLDATAECARSEEVQNVGR